MSKMADTKIGKISHYYDKIGVAVVELDKNLSVGDSIKIMGHGNEFTQTVESMQLDHKAIQKAGKGQGVGMKVSQAVKEGAEVYKV